MKTMQFVHACREESSREAYGNGVILNGRQQRLAGLDGLYKKMQKYNSEIQQLQALPKLSADQAASLARKIDKAQCIANTLKRAGYQITR